MLTAVQQCPAIACDLLGVEVEELGACIADMLPTERQQLNDDIDWLIAIDASQPEGMQ